MRYYFIIFCNYSLFKSTQSEAVDAFRGRLYRDPEGTEDPPEISASEFPADDIIHKLYLFKYIGLKPFKYRLLITIT